MSSLLQKVRSSLFDIEKVVDMTGATKEQVIAASESLKTTDIVDLVSHFLNPPLISGSKYIPSKPVIDDGLTSEVREKLVKARELLDILNLNADKKRSNASGLQSDLPKIQDVEVVASVPVLEKEPVLNP